jgi:putative FmdB family regulatory protein
MPTYVFKCVKCGHVLEQLMTMGEYAQTPLPKCAEEGCDGQQEMKPQITGGTGFVLKGTGWTPKTADSWGAPTEAVMPKKR